MQIKCLAEVRRYLELAVTHGKSAEIKLNEQEARNGNR